MIVLWFYYSKFYIAFSLVMTLLINKVTNKLYIAPLLINMVSLILLLLSNGNKSENMYLGYVPVVLTSIILNLIIFIKKLVK